MDIAKLLGYCVEQGASDLHIAAGTVPRLRINGELKQLGTAIIEPDQAQQMLLSIMNEQQQQQACHEYLDLDFAYVVANIGRFRVNVFQQTQGVSAVFRVIPAQVPSLEELKLDPIFRTLAGTSHGLICITGPTGSGKSTTLAAILDFINQNHRKHIITIEDPVEFTHTCKQSLVSQRAVGQNTRSFHAALRSALREDLDVILIGEIRDFETVSLALTAAETGHLVLTSLHTASAAKAIDRIIDLFPGAEQAMIRSMLAESLQAVVAQILLPKAGGGRIAAQEVLIGTVAIRNLIREGKIPQIYSAIETGAQFGMRTLDQHLLQLAKAGLISTEIARQQAKMPDQLGLSQAHPVNALRPIPVIDALGSQ